MNLMSMVPSRGFHRMTRRQRAVSFLVEHVEPRLAPSPTLPLPPPHVPTPIFVGAALNYPTVGGNSVLSVHYQPPDPCVTTHFQPPDPC
jgi:hypothetical protein